MVHPEIELEVGTSMVYLFPSLQSQGVLFFFPTPLCESKMLARTEQTGTRLCQTFKDHDWSMDMMIAIE